MQKCKFIESANSPASISSARKTRASGKFEWFVRILAATNMRLHLKQTAENAHDQKSIKSHSSMDAWGSFLVDFVEQNFLLIFRRFPLLFSSFFLLHLMQAVCRLQKRMTFENVMTMYVSMHLPVHYGFCSANRFLSTIIVSPPHHIFAPALFAASH